MKKQTRKNNNGVSLIGGLLITTILILMAIITILQESSYKNYGSDASETIRKEVLHRYDVKKDFTYDEDDNLNTKLLSFDFEVKEEYLQYVNAVQITINTVSVDFIVDGNYYEFEFAKNDGKLKLNYAVENGTEYNEELVNKFFVI